jgi:hypothetical protein
MSDDQNQLKSILHSSPIFQSLFKKSYLIDLPNWYVAGGCVTQTIWNWKMKLDPMHGLKDIDLVYFDSQSENEELDRQKINTLFNDLLVPVDVINQAHVHVWYPKKFGYEIPAYTSTEDGISTWLPAFCIGVRPEDSSLKVFAPFGLTDAFEMVVRPNKRQITEAIYSKMTLRLLKDWPSIKIVPWS